MFESSHLRSTCCVFFAYNGRSLVKLPITPDEAITLIENTGDSLHFMRFSLSDGERITAALRAGAAFCYSIPDLHIASASRLIDAVVSEPILQRLIRDCPVVPIQPKVTTLKTEVL